MFVVAIAQLGGPADAEAQALASDLGVTAYEARLILAGGFPALVLSTPERDAALGLLGKLRARGHAAIACDTAAVVPSSRMVSMRRFDLDLEAVIATDKAERLPFDDVLALLAATHKASIESETASVTQKFRPGLALATGGLVMRTASTKATSSTAVERERVLYVFRRSGELPWLLRENATHYTALGQLDGGIARSRAENFQKTVTHLRERAPRAVYDDALLALKRIPEQARVDGNAGAKTTTTSSEAGTDLMAHLLALIIGKRQNERGAAEHSPR